MKGNLFAWFILGGAALTNNSFIGKAITCVISVPAVLPQIHKKNSPG